MSKIQEALALAEHIDDARRMGKKVFQSWTEELVEILEELEQEDSE